jgi:hypothetical protein
MNYPNPATNYTTFTFEHNMADEELTVSVYVYNLAGMLVSTFSEQVTTTGYNTVLSQWNLRDSNGNLLGQGIYPYCIRITDSDGNFAECYQKLVVIR